MTWKNHIWGSSFRSCTPVREIRVLNFKPKKYLHFRYHSLTSSFQIPFLTRQFSYTKPGQRHKPKKHHSKEKASKLHAHFLPPTTNIWEFFCFWVHLKSSCFKTKNTPWKHPSSSLKKPAKLSIWICFGPHLGGANSLYENLPFLGWIPQPSAPLRAPIPSRSKPDGDQLRFGRFFPMFFTDVYNRSQVGAGFLPWTVPVYQYLYLCT